MCCFCDKYIFVLLIMLLGVLRCRGRIVERAIQRFSQSSWGNQLCCGTSHFVTTQPCLFTKHTARYQVQSNVLSMLTRMRQIALHPGLAPSNYLEHLRASIKGDEDGPAQAISITPADKIRLQGLLAQAIEDNEECPVCFDILNVPRITTCSHMFCLAW